MKSRAATKTKKLNTLEAEEILKKMEEKKLVEEKTDVNIVRDLQKRKERKTG